MKRNILLLIVLTVSTIAHAQTKVEKKIITSIESRADTYKEISLKIWDLAEVGYKEVGSTQLLQEEPQEKPGRRRLGDLSECH